MFLVTIRNDVQQTRHHHDQGPLVIGRAPGTDVPHIVVQDDYVSRRQLLLQEVNPGQIQIENVGRHALKLYDGKRLENGESIEVALPTQLQIVNTLIVLDGASQDPSSDESTFETISLPASRQTVTARGHTTLVNNGQLPSPETLAGWFETLISVQQAATGSTEFYQETAQAVVDMVGLDRGLVLMRESPDSRAWRIIASSTRSQHNNVEYSMSVLDRVLTQQRTFFGKPSKAMSKRDSLSSLEAVAASPIFDETGSIVGVLYGSRDFTGEAAKFVIHPLEAQVLQLLATSISTGLARLRSEERMKQVQQMAAVGQALGYIMHDLRGPIGNARQLTDMLRSGEQEPFTTEEQFDFIEESLNISLEMLNDALEFSRGSVAVQPRRGNCRELLAKQLRLMRMDLAEAEVEFRVEIDEDLVVELDPERVARVLRNLVNNAAEAVKGRPGGWVELGAQGSASSTELWVRDNGPGIPPEIQSRLFQPFATQGKHGGTGFGLAIAKQLVEAHDGEITVVSNDQGTHFRITLPVFANRSGSASRAKSDEETRSDETWSNLPLRILVADDEPINRRLIGSLLEKLGHQVSLVGNGREAVEAVGQQRDFDLIVLDMHMPEMDGLTAAATIRGTEKRRTPIVVLTAEHSEATRQRCLDADMDDCLAKPISLDELRDVLKRYCQKT